MAEVLIVPQKPEAQFDVASQGWRYQRRGVVVVGASGDTLTLGTTHPPIMRLAWEPLDTSDPMAVTHSGGTITFTGTAGSGGYLHIWSLG